MKAILWLGVWSLNDCICKLGGTITHLYMPGLQHRCIHWIYILDIKLDKAYHPKSCKIGYKTVPACIQTPEGGIVAEDITTRWAGLRKRYPSLRSGPCPVTRTPRTRRGHPVTRRTRITPGIRRTRITPGINARSSSGRNTQYVFHVCRVFGLFQGSRIWVIYIYIYMHGKYKSAHVFY